MGVAAYAAWYPFNSLLRMATFPFDSGRLDYPLAIAATACLLPPYLWLVISAAGAVVRDDPAELRSTTARLLADGTVRHCVIALTRHNGRIALQVRHGQAPPPREVTSA